MAKILVFGQAQFGQRVFEGVLARGHGVTAVCVPPDGAGRPPDPLKAAALEKGVRVVQRKSYRGAEAEAEVAPGAADAGVLAYVTQIVPGNILEAPRLGSICFHPSLLPAYRGGSAINWQIINGEKTGGVTLFRPDDGIDTGPVYLQKTITIGADDSAGSYYYGRVFEAGIAATLESIELVLSGRAVAREQEEALATYEPLCRDEHAVVDWGRGVQQVHDLIRGCDPSPGAHCRSGDAMVRMYGSRVTSRLHRAEPGTVLAISEAGVEIATAGGSVLLAKLGVGGKKLAAAEGAGALGLQVGARLAAGTLPRA
ncbi:MAG: methionyl-tRNA formyltransferase [Deltaproteobacteria bacterium]|nr:methionyl-tRNA formyltransferase [Deltaproteobacteria bacterium]